MAATSVKKSSMCLSVPSDVGAAGGGGAPASKSPRAAPALPAPCTAQGKELGEGQAASTCTQDRKHARAQRAVAAVGKRLLAAAAAAVSALPRAPARSAAPTHHHRTQKIVHRAACLPMTPVHAVAGRGELAASLAALRAYCPLYVLPDTPSLRAAAYTALAAESGRGAAGCCPTKQWKPKVITQINRVRGRRAGHQARQRPLTHCRQREGCACACVHTCWMQSKRDGQHII